MKRKITTTTRYRPIYRYAISSLVLCAAVTSYKLWTREFLRIAIDGDPDFVPRIKPHSVVDGAEEERELKLRFNWTNLERHSSLARDMAIHQGNCNLPARTFLFASNGLGSDLHLFSRGICNAMEENKFRLRTRLPWVWHHQASCNAESTATTTALSCYFTEAETACPDDEVSSMPDSSKEERIGEYCPNLTNQYSVSDIRAATTEFLFTRVSPIVQREAERQLNLVFGTRQIPENLITVHMRWGDKGHEMKLVDVASYIEAVEKIVRENLDEGSDVNIFLATEDPDAVTQFRRAAPQGWTIYIDQYYREMLPYRNQSMHHVILAELQLGRPGIVALGSLLVAMEANYFVLTTASNWSRLLNELRRNVVDPRCNNCTKMIDLLFDEW